MKVTYLFTIVSSLTLTQAIPLDIWSYFYKRDFIQVEDVAVPVAWVGRNTSNSTSNGTMGTNDTNSTTGGSTGLPLIKIISFSENFTEIWGTNTTKVDNNQTFSLSLEQIVEVLDLSGNETDDGVLSMALKQASLGALLNASGIDQVATIDYQQIGSQFNDSVLPLLYDTISSDYDSDGFVVLVGARDLESAAFFTEVLGVYVPVVFTIETTSQNLIDGGLLDLYNSIIVAASAETNAFGSQIVAGRTIGSGFYSFNSPADTQLGRVYKGEPQWFFDYVTYPYLNATLYVDSGTELPSVPILEVFDSSTDILRALEGSDLKGLIIATSSDSFSGDFLEEVRRFQFPLVFASSDGGFVNPQDVEVEGAYAGGLLTPVKAQVLLQLALASSLDDVAIRDLFVSVYGG